MKRLRKSTWLHRNLYPALGASLIRLVGATCQVKFHDPHGAFSSDDRQPYIYAFWHSRLFLMPVIYRRMPSRRKLTALISPSRDGELIASVAGRFGIDSARGSSSKQARVGVRELIRAVKEEASDLIITPDGPRGPAEVVQPGTLYVAAATGAPIVPVTCTYTRYWPLKSWDRFQVTQPFATANIHLHAPMVVDPSWDEAKRAEVLTELAQTMKGTKA